jgi:hypothetical protein
MPAALVSPLAVGAWQNTLLRLSYESAMVPAVGGCSVARMAVPGAGAGIPGFGARVPGAEAWVPEAGAKTVLLNAECCHLAGDLDSVQNCGAVGGWTNAR